MLFTVIIPTYNRELYLRKTLDSVWEQTFKDFEVIIVDDGSTDGTKEYVSSLGEKVTLIHQSNAGPGAARNRGAEAARGKYLAFLDSDDLWFPWTLETAASIIDTVGSPSFISGKIVVFTETATLKVAPAPVAYEAYPNYLLSSDALPFVGSCAMILRRDTFISVGGFLQENINAEDHDISLRVSMSGEFVTIQAPVTVGYRAHQTNLTKSLMNAVKGTQRLLDQENRGAYPGGSAYRRNRHQILGSHLRPVAVVCARAGLQRQGWSLYRQTFSWHLALFRLKFLIGFPIISLWNALTRKRHAR